ncbi:MAG: ABC transporter ATP-binding protein [Betaproteobacteria bacterium]|nr:ABC transporter ATP-binding protein [Betaproteobacteria bacterium]
MLEVKGLSAGYGGIAVLHEIDLHAMPGEAIAIIGANGAGKSTLLRALSGIIQLRSGSIRFGGRDIAHSRADTIVNEGLIHCPEGRAILKRMSVRENLEMGAFRLGKPVQEEDFRSVYEMFPVLRERQRQTGGLLSGGEQQMLAIGRAMMGRPRMLMLDEPSLGLSPIMVKEVFKALTALKKSGLTILLVEQNALAALRFSDRAYVLEHGRIAVEGESRSLSEDVRVRDAYLGAA